MRKNIFKMLIFVVTLMCFPFTMHALDVSTTTELNACLATTGNTCKLIDDIDYGSVSYILIQNKEITLDLNGHTLKFNSPSGVYLHTKTVLTVMDSSDEQNGQIYNTKTSSGYGISMTKGSKVIVESGKIYAYYSAIYNYSDDDANEIIINGGEVEGYWYAAGVFDNDVITVNGGTLKSRGSVILNNGSDVYESTINIKGGKVIQLDDDNPAIYHPGVGTVNVSGGEIIGGAGIEMRSGTLNVTGGTIEATYNSVVTKKNGSGATTKGTGIGVSQHTTNNPIEINVSGGTIKGYAPFYQKNIEGNDSDALNKIKFNITGGKFIVTKSGTESVYSENFESFITGGHYSIDLDSKYILKPYVSVKLAEDDYIVKLVLENKTEALDVKEAQKEEAVIGLSEKNVEKASEIFLETIENDEELIDEVKGYDISVVLETSKKDSVDVDTKKYIEKKLSDKDVNLQYYDIDVVIYEKGTENKLGNITELSKPITVTLVLPTDIEKLKEGYKRTYYIARNHEGKVKLLDTKLSKDGTYLTFKSDKFSVYTLVYKDTIINPDTADNINLYIVLNLLSLFGLLGFAYNKKRFN